MREFRRVCLPYGDPLAAFAPFAGREGAVLLESAAQDDARGRYSFVCPRPLEVWADPADPFAALEQARRDWGLGDWRPVGVGPVGRGPVGVGLVGWLSYEAARHREAVPVAPEDAVSAALALPEAVFAFYPAVAVYDHHQQQAWMDIAPAGEDVAAAWLADWPQELPPSRPPPAYALRCDRDRAQALAAAQAVIEHIKAGDIFQANVTHRFSGTLAAPPTPEQIFDLYRVIRQRSPAPFAVCASFGRGHLLSASPERFLAVSPSGAVETRPIKGTRPRGATPDADAAWAAELMASEKDRAENVMIVDLMRNDLSRSCALGSVRVSQLCGLESFAAVHHLVSVVQGQLRADVSAATLLARAFPGGSIVGAPKIEAMRVLRQLEPWRRGLYCGSVLRWGGDGAFDSSIVIRSLMVGASGVLAAHAGGGVVADSDPLAEWQETLTKVAPLLAMGPLWAASTNMGEGS